MILREQLIEQLFEKKVIQISTNPMFTLTSGKKAPVYIDHRRIFSFPDLRKQIISYWADQLECKYDLLTKKEDLVFAGTATAGIAPAYALAEHFQCGFVYVRSKAKEHGLKSAIEGVLSANAQVIVIDDMVTTGSSLLSAVERLCAENQNVICASSISRHALDSSAIKFQKAGVELVSLFQTNQMFQIALDKNAISKDDFSIIQNWLLELNKQEE